MTLGIKSSLIKNILNEVILMTKELYGNKLEKIILYGSYARDEQDEESDIDIMILLDMDDEELKIYDKKLNEIMSDIGYKYIKLISIIDISYEKFNDYLKLVPFYNNVFNEGIIIYSR